MTVVLLLVANNPRWGRQTILRTLHSQDYVYGKHSTTIAVGLRTSLFSFVRGVLPILHRSSRFTPHRLTMASPRNRVCIFIVVENDGRLLIPLSSPPSSSFNVQDEVVVAVWKEGMEDGAEEFRTHLVIIVHVGGWQLGSREMVETGE